MKKFKNFVVLVMALAMFLSAGLGSVQLKAAGEGSITVTGATNGKEYSVFKIFDLTYTGSEEKKDLKVTYTIAEDWKAFFVGNDGSKYIVASTTEDLNKIIVDGNEKFINITNDNIAQFAVDASKYITNEKLNGATKQKAAGETVEFKGLDLGYYLVYPHAETKPNGDQKSIVSLTSTTPNAETKVKATFPTIEKEVVEKDYEIGKEISYTLKGNVPDTTGYSKYTYKITDELSGGLTLDTTSVKVYIGEAEQKENVTLTITKAEDNSGKYKIEADFNVLNLQDKVGQEIRITYTAKLNEKAVTGNDGNPNNVTLEYSNDPKNEDSTDTTKKEKKVYTAAIQVLKHEKGDESKLLKGAKFKLKNVNEGKNKDKFYKLVDGKVTWVDEKDADEKETNTDGVVEFKGLENGKYQLVETEAPKGYNKLTAPVDVDVDYNNLNKTTYQEAKVENSAGTTLPGTGGIGTTIFSVIGGLIILFAVLSLSKSKVKKARN